jgi:hypothetical protein
MEKKGQGIASEYLLILVSRRFSKFDLDDWRWVNRTAVTLLDTTNFCPLRLLAN